MADRRVDNSGRWGWGWMVGNYIKVFQPSDHVEGEVVNMAGRGMANSGSWGFEKTALVGNYI